MPFASLHSRLLRAICVSPRRISQPWETRQTGLAAWSSKTDDQCCPHIPVLLNEVLQAFHPVQLHVRHHSPECPDGATSMQRAALRASLAKGLHHQRSWQRSLSIKGKAPLRVCCDLLTRAMQTFVDGTLGAAGHSLALIEAHPELQRLIGFDQDASARALSSARLGSVNKEGFSYQIVADNFRNMKERLSELCSSEAVDGVLLDLGVSSMQLDDAARGFSFMQDGPLDMRMNCSAGLSAAEVVNSWSEQDLGRIIREYGEDRTWKTIARKIVDARAVRPISTTKELVNVIGQTRIRSSKRAGSGSRGPHPATRTFQAIRIAVNDELRACEEVVPAALDCLRPGGRLAVITFHSLEDRIVKWAMRKAAGMSPVQEDLAALGTCAFQLAPPDVAIATLVSRKPIIATAEEEALNPRARSAKLRVIEKL